MKPKTRICAECGELKRSGAFYRGRRICKACMIRRASRLYTVRAWLPGDSFICRRCGKLKSPEEASSYACNLCKNCHAENLRRKWELAPDTLKCRTCKLTKPKTEFSCYSTTRCKACACRLAKQKRGENHED